MILIIGVIANSEINVFDIAYKFSRNPIIIFQVSNNIEKFYNDEMILRMMKGNPNNFQGIVYPFNVLLDIKPDTVLEESLKDILSNIEMEWINKTQYSIFLKNNFEYINLSEFYFDIELYKENDLLASTSILNVNIESGENDIFKVDLDYRIKPDEIYQLIIFCRLKNSKLWAERGFIINKFY